MKFRASITKTVTFSVECNSEEELQEFLLCSSDQDVEKLAKAVDVSFEEEILYPLKEDAVVDFCIS